MVVSDWLEQIGDCIRFKPMTVWFSTSYLMYNSSTELIYVYTCKESCMYHTKLSTKVRLSTINFKLNSRLSLNGQREWSIISNKSERLNGNLWKLKLQLKITMPLFPLDFDHIKSSPITFGLKNNLFYTVEYKCFSNLSFLVRAFLLSLYVREKKVWKLSHDNRFFYEIFKMHPVDFYEQYSDKSFVHSSPLR